MISKEHKRILSGYTLSKVDCVELNGEQIIDFKFKKGDFYVGCTLYHTKGEQMFETLKKIELFIEAMVENVLQREEQVVCKWAQSGRMS